MPSNSEANKPEVPRLLDYHLPRSLEETIRLNAQHHALITRNGWLLHPKIRDSIPGMKEAQIADVACGTGIWAFEVADKFPTTRVTGLDVSAKQFPPPWSWPSNCKLGILDLAGDVPLEYQGKFDVVHCRFLLIAGPIVDQKVFINAFSKLLKPGGWLQWQEMTYPPGSAFASVRDEAGVLKGYEEKPVVVDTIEKIASFKYKTSPVPKFGEWMRENSNFKGIEHFDLQPLPRHGRLETNLMCGAIHGAATLMLQMKHLDEATKEALRYEQGTGERYEAAGVLCSYRLGIILARASES